MLRKEFITVKIKKHEKAILFISVNLFQENEELLKLVLPGIDRGGGLHFEAKLDLPREEIKKLMPKVVKCLKKGIIVDYNY